MFGGGLVVLWLTVFSIISFCLCNYLKLNTILLKTIFVWTFLMVFVGIFEMMLIFKHSYLQEKSEYYYKNSSCYWNENNDVMDIFSWKMYIDLYADYSLCDKRYGESLQNNEGCRFVLMGEIIHGIFSIIMSVIILYFYFFNFNEFYIYTFSILFSSVQFALIVWYLTSVFFEMYFVKNDKFWCYPLLWNVPWIIIPVYIFYYAIMELNITRLRIENVSI
jgi:hypothetical protein